MPRRRDFRGVAFGLLGAFVSRNNDVNGYWALGKLYEHVKAFNAGEIRVDLVRSVITPPSTEFSHIVGHFRQMLADQLAARSLPNEWLRDVNIRVKFSGEKSVSVDNPRDGFECLVTITDDLGHVHQARDSGECWVHDPCKELKRTRANL